MRKEPGSSLGETFCALVIALQLVFLLCRPDQQKQQQIGARSKFHLVVCFLACELGLSQFDIYKNRSYVPCRVFFGLPHVA
ncbi:MAG: hypothetical protein ACXV7G_14130, partial [Halobacteriota archaeon]